MDTEHGKQPILLVEKVEKSFGTQAVLRGVDLVLYPGETLVLLGGSGSGKSVLLGVLIGLLEADGGTVSAFGKDITAFHDEFQWKEHWSRVGFLFQGSALFDSMSVRDNIAFPLEMHTDLDRTAIDEKVGRLLEMISLGDIQNKMPSELSGGMQKRVALARTIALEPEIILYDEPTTGLDPITSDTIADLIRELQTRLGITSLVVTHDIRLAFKVADRVAMLTHGKIYLTGSLDAIKEHTDPMVREFLYGSIRR
ncbi:MAG: ATP-binding cassette domain-containing protein [bacterium]|nr:ATP-binding cassette domain-containing protein [bacterium]